MSITIQVFIACHNRKAKTITCLKSLTQSAKKNNLDLLLQVHLCDDGSQDNTSSAVTELLGNQATIVFGNGNLFWNRGMIMAWESYTNRNHEDLILLINDDVKLTDNSLEILMNSLVVAAENSPAIIVGSTSTIRSNSLSYGGFHRGPWWNRLKIRRLQPTGQMQSCDTFNCNIVLANVAVFDKIHFLDHRFIHSMGDIDLGLRAKKVGIPIFIAPGILGHCDENPDIELKLNRWQIIKRVFSVRDCPPGPWFTLVSRHGGIFWPILFIMPYIKTILGSPRRKSQP